MTLIPDYESQHSPLLPEHRSDFQEDVSYTKRKVRSAKSNDCGTYAVRRVHGCACDIKALYVTVGFPRISKSPCASKEIRFSQIHLPTIYQRNRRAKLAINTQTPVQVDLTIGQVFCFLNFFITYSCSSTTYKSNAILFRGNVAMLRLEQLNIPPLRSRVSGV